jgi:steroid delta-isomerase-like uncharacterized protein
MSAELEALARRFYDEIVNERKLELIDELVSPDFVEHEEFPGLPAGRDGVKAFFGMMFVAFPDMRFDVEEIVATGDTAVARLRMRGTQEGAFMDIPATGKQIDVPSIDWVRIKDGQAVEHWGVTDTGAMMQQLGVGG